MTVTSTFASVFVRDADTETRLVDKGWGRRGWMNGESSTDIYIYSVSAVQSLSLV